MKPLRGVFPACALWLLGAAVAPAHAAWDNVFQMCCASCGQAAVSNYAPDPCCAPPPQPVCTTHYVQRCYYQPVTCYENRSYYEPVTTYRTSYYYEPVTSFRYSCYVDPCTGCQHQVACPVRSYALKTQCCPVQSWVQRCCRVPVTKYQQVSYYEPVTTCCAPPPPPCCPTAYAPPCHATAPAAAVPGAPAQPGVLEQSSPPAGVIENPGTGSQSYKPYGQIQPNANGAQRPVPRPLSTQPTAPVQRQPAVRLDRVVSGPAGRVQGHVVSQGNVPQAGASLTFVSAARRDPHRVVTADNAGNFRVTLASGDWLVYVQGADGKLAFARKIDVRDNETRQFTLVSR
jgi:hypothetical protein